jgi:hypothetical protein
MDNTEREYEIQKLNLLAFPRNQIPKCSLTGVTATVQLITPHITLVGSLFFAHSSSPPSSPLMSATVLLL